MSPHNFQATSPCPVVTAAPTTVEIMETYPITQLNAIRKDLVCDPKYGSIRIISAFYGRSDRSTLLGNLIVFGVRIPDVCIHANLCRCNTLYILIFM